MREEDLGVFPDWLTLVSNVLFPTCVNEFTNDVVIVL